MKELVSMEAACLCLIAFAVFALLFNAVVNFTHREKQREDFESARQEYVDEMRPLWDEMSHKQKEYYVKHYGSPSFIDK